MINLIKAILCIGFFAFAVISSFAQDYNEFGYVDSSFIKKASKFNTKKVILKTNPLAILSGDIPIFSSEFRLVGEFVTSPKTSVVLGASYLGMGLLLRAAYDNDTNFTSQGLSSWDIGFNGFRIQGGFKYYLKNPRISISDPDFKPAPGGFYIYPMASYSTAKYYEKVNKDDYFRFTHWSVTMNIGVQFLMGERITLDPYLGVGYKKNTITDSSGLTPADLVEEMKDSFIYGANLKLNLGLNMGIRF